MIEKFLTRRHLMSRTYVNALRRVHRQMGEQLEYGRQERELERQRRGVATKEDVGLLLGHGDGHVRDCKDIF